MGPNLARIWANLALTEPGRQVVRAACDGALVATKLARAKTIAAAHIGTCGLLMWSFPSCFFDFISPCGDSAISGARQLGLKSVGKAAVGGVRVKVTSCVDASLKRTEAAYNPD